MQGTWENGRFVLASTKNDQIDRLRKDAERYAARRKSVFLTQQRLQISGPRMTEAEFNANYDAGCDKNLAGYVTDHRGVWVKDEAMTLTSNLM